MQKDKNTMVNAALDLYSKDTIQSRIFTIRGQQVIMDADLAEFYQVKTIALNQAVKRNESRFPDRYRFQLNENEKYQLITNCDRFLGLKHSSYLPYAFTEQGVTQLSAVLRSKIAVEMSIRINDAFHSMRKFILQNVGIFQRMDSLERKQLETDQKIERVLDCLVEGTLKEKAHIFSAGQIFEAKSFITELISKAQHRVILIDGYVSGATLELLDARQSGIPATIYTSGVGKALSSLKKQYNREYPANPLEIFAWRAEQHDRWLVIDDELWHCGASLRDAGIRTFGIDPIGLPPSVVLEQV